MKMKYSILLLLGYECEQGINLEIEWNKNM